MTFLLINAIETPAAIESSGTFITGPDSTEKEVAFSQTSTAKRRRIMKIQTMITSIAALLFPLIAYGYQLLNPDLKTTWHSGTVPFYVNLGGFDNAANVALADWSQYTGTTHLLGVDVTSGSVWGNGRNDIVWSATIGQGMPSNVLAWTLPNYDWTTGQFIETDIWVNSNFQWGEFNGSGFGYDIERILLHEIGHAIGLGHSDFGTIMNPYYQYGTWELTSDDIAGARFLYGDKGTSSVPETGSSLALLAIALIPMRLIKRMVRAQERRVRR